MTQRDSDYTGQVGEIIVYDHTLTDDEVQELSRTEVAKFEAPVTWVATGALCIAVLLLLLAGREAIKLFRRR